MKKLLHYFINLLQKQLLKSWFNSYPTFHILSPWYLDIVDLWNTVLVCLKLSVHQKENLVNLFQNIIG